jgi:hypothetical protein
MKGGAAMAHFKLDQKAAEEARKAKNAYARAWRAANKDKVRQYNENYWQKKAAQNGEAAAAERR